MTLKTPEKRNVSFNNMVREAIEPIATKRNALGAALLTAVFTVGSHFGFEEYENRLERRGMETLHPYENIIMPIAYDEDNNEPSAP